METAAGKTKQLKLTGLSLHATASTQQSTQPSKPLGFASEDLGIAKVDYRVGIERGSTTVTAGTMLPAPRYTESGWSDRPEFSFPKAVLAAKHQSEH